MVEAHFGQISVLFADVSLAPVGVPPFEGVVIYAATKREFGRERM